MPRGESEVKAHATDAPHIGPFTPAHARRLRTYAWAALPLCALAYYTLLSSSLPHLTRLFFLEAVYCTPVLLTVVWSIRSRTLSEGSERVFWGALAGAIATLLTCEILLVWWVAMIDPAGPPRVSWPFHVLHAIAAAQFIVALGSLSRFSQAPAATSIRWSLDSTSIALVAGVLLLEFYVRPIMEPAGAPISEVLLGVGYPLFGLVMVGGTLANLVGFKVDRWRTWDKLVAISLTMYAIAISLWPIWYTTATVTSRNYERGVLDLVQFSGHWLLMAAAVYRLTEVHEWRLRPLPPFDTARYRWASAVVPTIILLGVPLLAFFAVQAYGESDWFLVYIFAFTALTALALGRSVLIALENGVLFDRSVTDPLTGLHNMRFFHDRLAEEVEQARRYGEELTVIALDLDEFSLVNERFGHAEGERLLREVGALLRSGCRRECIVSRLGGDDFAIIVPRTGALEGAVLARRVIDIISIGAGTEPGIVTASAGLASFPRDASDADELRRHAEGALYHAKQFGRESLVAFEDERVPDLTPADRIERLERQTRLSSVRALAAAVGARDPDTYSHARNVATLAVDVARQLGLDDVAVDRTETAALLHDVGKIGQPDLHAIGDAPITRDRRLGDHAAAGQRILADSGLMDLMPVVRSHHERWDGTGHPDGLRGTEIPIESRILAACDVYESMITDRPGRPAVSRRHALSEVADRAGTQLDPKVVKALLSVLGAGTAVMA